MRDEFKGENLQVGDNVIVVVSGIGFSRRYVGEVVKRTPTGLLDVIWEERKNPTRFRKEGYEYHRSHDCYGSTSYYLENYDDKRAEEINRYNRARKIAGFLGGMDWNKYTVDELYKIYDFVKGLRST